jgi:hypothetical protein
MRQTVAALTPPNKPLTTGSLTKLVAGRLSNLDIANASLIVTFCAILIRLVVVDVTRQILIIHCTIKHPWALANSPWAKGSLFGAALNGLIDFL